MKARSFARRLALGAITAAALAAAPASALADDNLALPENGGVVHVSSELGSYPSSAINNGLRDGGAARGWQGFWNDATNGVFPDWAEVRWDAPQRIDRLVIKIPIGTPGLPAGDRELGSARIQWWDDAAGRYVDVVDENGGDNPVLDWYAETVEDPGQTRTFAFPSVTTTRVRVLIEEGAADGNSWLDEIEAYGAGCVGGGNRALPEGGGYVTVSSQHSGATPWHAINNGEVDGGTGWGFWVDGTPFAWPDVAQVEWAAPQLITRLVVRIPIGLPGSAAGLRTLTSVRIQYQDAASGRWLDVVDSRGAPNPVLDWESATVADPGQTRRFHFAAPTWVSAVRVVVEGGTTDGHSFLDEIEAHGPQCANANLALRVHGGRASVSSETLPYNFMAINDGIRNFWLDGTVASFPDWAQVAWAEPQTIGRLVLRIPKGNDGPPVGYRTLREVRVETWDLSASRWVAVPSTSAAPNPILNWVSSTTWDGSQERSFAFTPVTTDKVRVVIVDGTEDQISWFDEIEAYAR